MTRRCSLCDRPHQARGYCSTHYARLVRDRYRTARATRDMTLAERLEHHSVRMPWTGCQIWIGEVSKFGYGRIGKGGHEVLLAHRAAWELAVGPVPDGFLVMHTCDVPACVNVAHLALGRKADNSADAANKGRLRRGERHHWHKLSEEQVQAVYDDPRPQRAIARDYGVCQQAVSVIKRGERWHWLTAPEDKRRLNALTPEAFRNSVATR